MDLSKFWIWESAFYEDYTVYGMKVESNKKRKVSVMSDFISPECMSDYTWTTKDRMPERFDGRFLKNEFGDFPKSWKVSDLSFYTQQNKEDIPSFPLLGPQLLSHPFYKIQVPLHGLVWNSTSHKFHIFLSTKTFFASDLERNVWFSQYLQLMFQTMRHSRYRQYFTKDIIDFSTLVLFRYPQLTQHTVNIEKVLSLHSSTQQSVPFSTIHQRAMAIHQCRIHNYSIGPSHFPYAYPNMKFDAEWYTSSLRQEKERLALSNREWTLLPYVTVQKRRELISKFGKEITRARWEEKEGLDYTNMSIIEFFQYHCVIINSTYDEHKEANEIKNHFIHPRTWTRFSSFFGNSFPTTKRVFVDFEWTRDYLYLVGVWVWDVHENKGEYHSFWAKNLDSKSEFDLLMNVYQFLDPYRDVLYYYFAEPSAWVRFCRKYGMEMEITTLFENAMDIHKIFWEGPIVFRGCYTCKLKDIAKTMKTLGYITIPFPSEEGSVENGKHSMEIAESMYRTIDPIEKTKQQASLQKYNQFDVESLCEIWSWISRQSS